MLIMQNILPTIKVQSILTILMVGMVPNNFIQDCPGINTTNHIFGEYSDTSIGHSVDILNFNE